MISERCDFEDFVRQADGREYDDIIAMADREATEAERRRYMARVSEEEQQRCGQEYAECLKGFIAYMRYGLKPSRISPEVLSHFDRLREEALHSKRPAMSA